MFYDIVKRLIQIVDPLINEETATLTDKSFKAETILGLVIDPIIVDGYASLFNCMTVVRTSDSMTASSLNFNQWVGAWRYVFGLAAVVQLLVSIHFGTQ